MVVGILCHIYASGLFEGDPEKDQSEGISMYIYAHLDVLSAQSRAVKQRVLICLHSYLVLLLVATFQDCLKFGNF